MNGPPLGERDLAGTWHEQLAAWLQDAIAAGVPEANAMVLATADADGRPSARTVLMKGLDEAGLLFFTNLRSRKGSELAANPHAAAVFPWIALGRQAIVVGEVELADDAVSDAYFESRPHGSQIGARASAQSTVVPDRAALDAAWERERALHPPGSRVPRPAHWGGLRIRPATVEFWQGRADRMHDRLRFRRAGEAWVLERLAP